MSQSFAVGQRVRVRNDAPKGHCRTPHYLRGREGVIERAYGAFRNPEQLAYGADGLPKRELYWVRFEQGRLWPGYTGTAKDTLVAEIYEHWLERAE